MRWRLVSTCLLGAWLGATAPASAAPAPRGATPVVRWQLSLPGWGEPAADDSAAYFLTRTHEVLSIDGASGSIRWRSDTGGAGDVPTGTQVRLASTRVLVGDGGIVAFDWTSGRHVWRFDAPDGDDPGVFLGAADADLVVAGSPMGRLYAVDAVSGALRWTRDIAAGRRRVVFAPVHAGTLIVASFTTFDGPLSGGLVAFDRTGRRRWTYRFDAGAGAAGPPLVVGGVIAVARTDGRIEMVRPASGRRVWALGPEASMPSGTGRDIRALASRGDWLVVTSLKGPIRAYDVRGRRQRWEYVDGPSGRRGPEGTSARRPALRAVLRRLSCRTRSGDGNGALADPRRDPVVRLASCCVGNVDLRDGSRRALGVRPAPARNGSPPGTRPSLKGPRHRCPSSPRSTHQPG